MALQIRRGLDADRLTVTPLEGELIYVTDTGRIYVGDGTTAGGTFVGPSLADTFTELADDATPQLGANLDLNSNDITGTGNINITGTITTTGLGGNLDLNNNDIVGTGNINIDGTITATGNINLGDGDEDQIIVGGKISSGLSPNISNTYDLGESNKKWRNGYFAGLDVGGQIDAVGINARLIGDDSTIAYDPSNGIFEGTTFLGNLTGNVTGSVDGDISGSVFSDSSTLLVDGVNGVIPGEVTGLVSGQVTTSGTVRVLGTSGLIPDGENVLLADGFIDADSGRNSGVGINVRAARNDGSGNPVAVEPGDSLLDIVAGGWDGNSWKSAMAIKFAVDKNVTVSDEIIPGRIIFAAYDNTGNFGLNSIMVFTSEGKLSVGAGDAPQEKLHVQGNGLFSGNVKAASFSGSVVNDDSTTFIDAIDGSVTARSFVQFGSLTTSERDALAATNGMVIYNETDNKFQGFENGSWVNLV
jgi:hypothetical protein